jgi:hypothetical protein
LVPMVLQILSGEKDARGGSEANQEVEEFPGSVLGYFSQWNQEQSESASENEWQGEEGILCEKPTSSPAMGHR